MNQDLRKIKRKFGENMAKLCRKLFPLLLETENLLPKLLLDHFEPNKELYNDIVNNHLINNFKNYIFNLSELENLNLEEINKTPIELMNDAGYDLFECKTEEEIQYFKKYYAQGERLCTFLGNRLSEARVFFAVKKDVDNIKRENFKHPQREDLYGTSVISIQFSKDSYHTLSIKNRYNHSVNNADSTFSNNLDNIITGLTKSFEKEYGLVQQNISESFQIPNYVEVDGKFYKYNYMINRIFYCPNNIIIDLDNDIKVIRFESEKYIVLDYFILDLVSGKIITYDNNLYDSFLDTMSNIVSVRIKKNKDNKKLYFNNGEKENIEITLDKRNRMIELINNETTKIGDLFLSKNKTLQKIELPKVLKIGSRILQANKIIEDIYLPNVYEVGEYFFALNPKLRSVKMPNLKKASDFFLNCDNELVILDLPNLEIAGDYFMNENRTLETIISPKLKMINNNFLSNNQNLKYLYLENVEFIGNNFAKANKNLEIIIMPNLKILGDDFLKENRNLHHLYMPSVEELGNNVLRKNENLEIIELPNVKRIGKFFLADNKNIKKVNMGNLEEQGINFISAVIKENKVYCKVKK